MAGEAADSHVHKQLEGNHGRDRVAGQCENKLGVPPGAKRRKCCGFPVKGYQMLGCWFMALRCEMKNMYDLFRP